MSHPGGTTSLLVVGAGLAGWAAVRGALDGGLPASEIEWVERGERLLAGWRAKRLPASFRAPAEGPAQTAEGPLYDKSWLDALPARGDWLPPSGTLVSAVAEDETRELAAAGVKLRFGAKAIEVVRDAEGSFRVWFEHGPPQAGRRLILAPGGGGGHPWRWAEEWGMPLVERRPAGLNLRLQGSRGRLWHTLQPAPARVALARVAGAERIAVGGAVGGIHPWLGGDAVTRLTLMVPAALATARHRGELQIDWLPDREGGLSPKVFARLQEQAGRRTVAEHPWEAVAPPVWDYVLKAARVDRETLWRSLSMRQIQMLANQLTAARLPFAGFRLDREAGLQAGGIALGALVPGTFEARATKGLHWVGEVVDLHALDPEGNAGLAVAAGWQAGQAAVAGGIEAPGEN